MREYNKLSIELSKEGKVACILPSLDVPDTDIENTLPKSLQREAELNLPELSEVDVTRHFTALSNKNFGLDTGFYPLGSCTMKYNPKIDEDMANMVTVRQMHPYQPEDTVQGALKIMYNLADALAEITGMDKITLQPAAGAHGELTGLMIIKAFHESRNDFKRKNIIVPDSAHGTNPASAVCAGFNVIEIKSNEDGSVNIDALKAVLNEETAGFMLTNPSTFGVFEENIKLISELIHEAGGLLYYDGANMNAIMGITRPGDMGFDVVHLNLHKTFATPHGGGGPGSGPVGVKKQLIPFIPVPVVEFKNERYILNYDKPVSIGKVKNFYGNFGVMVKAYTYILTMGAEGLKKASETAVLNANYLKEGLKKYYNLHIDKKCKHEVVFGGLKYNPNNISTLDIAKRLLDYGFHPPTIYFPLTVHEAIMIEPTETEGLETLERFIEVMTAIADDAVNNAELLRNAPYSTEVRRIDEVRAARVPVLTWKH